MPSEASRAVPARPATKPTRAGLAVATAALWACVACDGAKPVVHLAPGTLPTGPLRLADLVDAGKFEITSPITGIEGVASLDAFADVPRESVYEQDFEDFDLAEGWPEIKTLRVTDAGGSRCLKMDRHPAGQRRVGWLIDVEPGTHYAFERRVKTNAPLAADFAVVETRATGQVLRKPRRLDYQSQGAFVRIHWPSPPDPDGEWHTGSVSFFTTQSTRRVVIVMRPTPEHHKELLQWGQGGEGKEKGAWFDDLTLHRVDPTPEQMIALVKARAPASEAAARLGIHKRGQFPPLGNPFTSHGPAHDNFSYRYALYAPPPTDLVFPVPVGANAAFHFSVCLSRETKAGEQVRFEIRARSGEMDKIMWSKHVTAEEGSWVWYDDKVDLSVFKGKLIELVLRTTPMVGNPHPMWGNPVVDVPPGPDSVRNVILIAVDTLRADRMSCYGYSTKTTPRLDKFAQDGVRFANTTSNSTWTCPSFASIFTGVVPSRHRVWAYAPVAPLPSRFVTLAERFRAKGWATNAIVYKAPLYGGGYDQGFDRSFNVPVGEAIGRDNLKEATEWLEANAKRRNFLFLHFDDPHQPFTQPAPFLGKFGARPGRLGIKLPVSFDTRPARNPNERKLVSTLYDEAVAYVDDCIGSFLDKLKARGLYDNSVIIFVSDHGEEMWEHGKFGHGGLKLWDEVTHVPLIVKPPVGPFARGKVVSTQVRGFDVMPTLLELAGLDVEEGLDAESLVPFLAPGAGSTPHRVAVAEIRKGGYAVRNPKWKYIRWVMGKETLYNLVRDKGEQKSVAAKHPVVTREMRLQLVEYLLLRRPGRFIVALGDKDGGAETIELKGVKSAFWFYGLTPRRTGGALLFKGKPLGRLVACSQLNADGDVFLAGSDQPVKFERYEKGQLKRLLKEGKRGLHFFDGPTAVVADASESSPLTPEMIQALNQLGYTGNAPDEPQHDEKKKKKNGGGK